MKAKVAKSGTIHFQHSMFSTDDRDPDYPPKADPSPPETEDVADPREFFQVDYREAYEVMLDALRNEEDPWLASISIDPQRSVPVGICHLEGAITLTEVLELAEIDRQYEQTDEREALAQELEFTDDWSM